MFVHLFKLHIVCNSNVLFEKKATIVDNKIIFIYLLDIVNSSSIHCFHPFPKLNLHYTLHQSKLFPSYMCLCIYTYTHTIQVSGQHFGELNVILMLKIVFQRLWLFLENASDLYIFSYLCV